VDGGGVFGEKAEEIAVQNDIAGRQGFRKNYSRERVGIDGSVAVCGYADDELEQEVHSEGV
jgi:hypothetical protein